VDVGGIGQLKKELAQTNQRLEAVHQAIAQLDSERMAAILEELRQIRQALTAS
jgi:cell division FtsZ-interacting protein ZapD